MSLSWNRRADILLWENALEIRHCTRLPGKSDASQRLEFSPGLAGSPWQAALDSLSTALAAAAPAAARVRLSGRFCRFSLLPWNRALTREEETALARAVFTETYGEAALFWEIRVDNLKRGETMLACAVDNGLLTGLSGVFASSRWRLAALQPLLAQALAGRDESGRCWNALVETDWWSAVLVEGEAFLAVINMPAQPAGLAGLAVVLDNENMRLALETRSLRLLRGSNPGSATADIPGWTIGHDAMTGSAQKAA